MRNLISLCLLATLAAQAAGQAIGNWTIYRFSRNCTSAVEPPKDQNRCSYHFFISEKPVGAPDASFQQCTIHVFSTWLPTTQIPWVAVPCLENTDVSKYAISSGWNSNGFITVNVMNLFTLENAYFGYDDKDLVGGAEVANKTERAYKFGTFEPLRPGGGERLSMEQRREEALVQRRDDCDAAWWVVKKLQRSRFGCVPVFLSRKTLQEGQVSHLQTRPVLITLVFGSIRDRHVQPRKAGVCSAAMWHERRPL